MVPTYSRCDVFWGLSLHKSGDDDLNGDPNDSPYLVINNPSHPFHGQDYIVLRLTTRPWDIGYHITEEDWEFGYPGDDSYVRTWNPMVFDSIWISRKQGQLKKPVVDEIVQLMTEDFLM